MLIPPVVARPVTDFLDSLGVNSSIDRRGEVLERTIECTKYLGIRWFRSGYEGEPSMADLIRLHKETGARFSWSALSGGNDLVKLLSTAKELASEDALLAFEGPNEPNNWGITYKGVFGGRDKSWAAVAALQRDMYAAVHADRQLAKYPVWGISECGAETDNVGLQFLTVPSGPLAGTRYSDFANVHNYIYHPNSPGPEDNKTWNAADPSPACHVDGLYGEYGVTWGRHFAGYSASELASLPRVTTETGCTIEGPVTEEIHGLNLLSLYLDQFKRGWSHNAVYLLRDRVDEAGNQKFGFYRPDYTPRRAAVLLHNLTTILADSGKLRRAGRLAYEISGVVPTVHDLLLQKSDGVFELVVWSELLKGSSAVTVRFGGPARSVTVFDPTVGSSATGVAEKRSSVDLVLTDHPVVLEVQGR